MARGRSGEHAKIMMMIIIIESRCRHTRVLSLSLSLSVSLYISRYLHEHQTWVRSYANIRLTPAAAGGGGGSGGQLIDIDAR